MFRAATPDEERSAGVDIEAFCGRPAFDVAPELIGAELTVAGVGGLIVEAEAYEPDDPASHSFRGERARNKSMFGPPGRAYVYRSYGIHWCLNVVCRRGSAVLLRALEPTTGIDVMRERRGIESERLLASGPGRLCQALGIDITHDGLPLDRPPFRLSPARDPAPLVTGTRIGITRAVEMPWRFGLSGSHFVSVKF